MTQAYRSNIAQGGLLLTPFRELLLQYRPGQSRQVFREALASTGTLAEYTESRQNDLLERFYLRFPTDVRNWPALRTLLEEAPPRVQVLALYFHTARTEVILGDFATGFLLPLWQEGKQDVKTDDANLWVQQATTQRNQQWSNSVALRATRSMLSIARDAGLLEGMQHKRLRYPHLPDAVTLYVLLTLQAQGFTSGQRVISHPDWRTMLLTESEVGSHLVRLAERGLIEWSATGSIYNLNVPASQDVTASVEAIRAAL